MGILVDELCKVNVVNLSEMRHNNINKAYNVVTPDLADTGTLRRRAYAKQKCLHVCMLSLGTRIKHSTHKYSSIK